MDEIGAGPVGLDTVVFIYLIEEHPEFFPVIAPVFEEMASGRLLGVTSTLTLLETLVVPYRVGNDALAEEYESILSHSRGLELVELGLPLLRAAAHLRAVVRIRTPDALQVMAAMSGGAGSFLTNDRRIPEIPGLKTLQIRDYLS